MAPMSSDPTPLIISDDIQNFQLLTAKANSRGVLPMRQDKFDYVVLKRYISSTIYVDRGSCKIAGQVSVTFLWFIKCIICSQSRFTTSMMTAMFCIFTKLCVHVTKNYKWRRCIKKLKFHYRFLYFQHLQLSMQYIRIVIYTIYL